MTDKRGLAWQGNFTVEPLLPAARCGFDSVRSFGDQEGWIKGECRASENNRRAKFYALTRAGRKHLNKETANWGRVSGAITRVLTIRKA